MEQYVTIEKLRQRANVTYDDARAALEACNWDVLDALIMLENQGKAQADQQENPQSAQQPKEGSWKIYVDNDIKKWAKRVWRFICTVVRKGNANTFIITNKKQEEVLSLPVTALVLLLIGFWPWTALILVAWLFFGARYAFKGPDLGQKVNDAMNRAADMAQGKDEQEE